MRIIRCNSDLKAYRFVSIPFIYFSKVFCEIHDTSIRTLLSLLGTVFVFSISYVLDNDSIIILMNDPVRHSNRIR